MLTIIHTHFESGLLSACQSCKSETLYKASESQSYEELFTYIRNELQSNPQVLPMRDAVSWLIIYVLPWYQLSEGLNQHISRRVACDHLYM